jgi:hypothetical protein
MTLHTITAQQTRVLRLRNNLQKEYLYRRRRYLVFLTSIIAQISATYYQLFLTTRVSASDSAALTAVCVSNGTGALWENDV